MFAPRLLNLSTALHLPCLLDKLEIKGSEREKVKSVYRRVKQCAATGSITTVVLVEACQIMKDTVKCTLKKRAYGHLFIFGLPAALNVASVPIYVITKGTKLCRYAIAIARLGSEIMKLELKCVNAAMAGLDLVIFGEVVPLYDRDNPTAFQLISNETQTMAETISTFID